MVLYILYIKADLEGIDSLSFVPGKNICISARNPLSQTETRERIVIDPSELHDAEIPSHEKHRNEAPSHFALKWEGQRTRSTIRILSDSSDEDVSARKEGKGKKSSKRAKDGVTLRQMTAEDSERFVPILKLECDGLEPYAFHPMGEEFTLVIKGGVSMEKVDLSSGDWSDYDLSYGSVSVSNFEAKFE
mmetsp:Transcript_40332/g.121513  ORF Transcript_40332/g.121513 Transcript_40332/m.121513 type:complete len:189 (-) Transcript_40332:23-589(-)